MAAATSRSRSGDQVLGLAVAHAEALDRRLVDPAALPVAAADAPTRRPSGDQAGAPQDWRPPPGDSWRRASTRRRRGSIGPPAGSASAVGRSETKAMRTPSGHRTGSDPGLSPRSTARRSRDSRRRRQPPRDAGTCHGWNRRRSTLAAHPSAASPRAQRRFSSGPRSGLRSSGSAKVNRDDGEPPTSGDERHPTFCGRSGAGAPRSAHHRPTGERNLPAALLRRLRLPRLGRRRPRPGEVAAAVEQEEKAIVAASQGSSRARRALSLLLSDCHSLAPATHPSAGASHNGAG